MSENWMEGLTHKDWLFDGCAIKGEAAIEQFNRLDWSKAWVDLGPSPAGNLGPYWHVPMDDGETSHRLYPRVLQTKWLMLINEACRAFAAKAVERSQRELQQTVIDYTGPGRMSDAILTDGKP